MSEPLRADLTPDELAALREVALRSVVVVVRDGGRLELGHDGYPRALHAHGAVFVTLRRDGALRGCVGTTTPSMSLLRATADRARAAALHDPRFRPVRADELDGLGAEVSVLSPLEPLAVAGYDELVATLRAGVDGLLVESGHRRGTFLPTVWQELADPGVFVAALWRKAGLAPDEWPCGVRVSRYGVQHS